MARQSGAVIVCVASLTFPLVSPLHTRNTKFGGQLSSARHEAAGCCSVHCCVRFSSLSSSSEALGEVSCVLLEHCSILYNNSARVHTFVTMAQFQLLYNLPFPQ